MRGDLLKLSTLAGVVGAFMMSVPATASAAEFDGQTVKVCTWGGPWKKAIEDSVVNGANGLAKRGATVEFVTGSPQDNQAKLIAARGKAICDVIEILDANWDQMVELGFLDKIDLDKVPNAKELPDYLVSDTRTGSWFTQEVICYNSKKFAEEGIPVPTTYKDLIHPKLEGRVQIPDITSGGGLANFGGIVHAAGGDETNVGPGLKLIADMKVRKFWKRGGEAVTLLESGDVWATIVHAGWCMRARKAGQEHVKVVHPKIKGDIVGVSKFGYLGIVKGSDPKNRAAVLEFLNLYLSADAQAHMSVSSGTVPVNEKAYPILSEDPVTKEMLLLDPAKVAKLLQVDYSKVDISQWNDQWNRSVTQ
jgi:putative spermidine/putrescine transport system substrate-binding protein